MGIVNSWGLCAILALPAIVAMYWLQPRVRTRRISGLFLWTEVAQFAGTSDSQKRSPTFAALDLATAALLIALACGLVATDSTAGDLYETWLTAGIRCLLSAGIVAVLITVWRSTGSEKAPQ